MVEKPRELNLDFDDDLLTETLLSTITQKATMPDARILLLVKCIKNGIFPLELIEEAKEQFLYFEQEQEKKEMAVQKEQERLRREYDKPDSKYHELYNNILKDPHSLKNWTKRTPTTDLEAYLNELNNRTDHYESLFHYNGIYDAIQTLEKLIEEKKASEKTTNIISKFKKVKKQCHS